MKRLICGVLMLAMLFPGWAAALESEPAAVSCRYEADGYATPEEAVLACIDGMKNLSLEQMVSTFAIETLAEHIDSAKYLGNVHAFSRTQLCGLPISGAYSRQLVVEKIHSALVERYYNQYIFYTFAGKPDYQDVSNGKAISFSEDEAVTAFIAAASDQSFADAMQSCTFTDWLAPEQLYKDYGSEQFQKMIDRNADIYGFDEQCSLAAQITLSGEKYLLVMDCCRYGDRWYNFAPSSLLSLYLGMSTEIWNLFPDAFS